MQTHKLSGEFYVEYESRNNQLGGCRSANVYLCKVSDPTFRRCIVDEECEIQNFPGIVIGEWINQLEYPLNNRVLFRFWIYAFKNEKALVEWTLQPDGRYFEDEDGFGGTNSVDITLHSYIDTDGNFTEPFKRRKIEY